MGEVGQYFAHSGLHQLQQFFAAAPAFNRDDRDLGRPSTARATGIASG